MAFYGFWRIASVPFPTKNRLKRLRPDSPLELFWGGGLLQQSVFLSCVCCLFFLLVLLFFFLFVFLFLLLVWFVLVLFLLLCVCLACDTPETPFSLQFQRILLYRSRPDLDQYAQRGVVHNARTLPSAGVRTPLFPGNSCIQQPKCFFPGNLCLQELKILDFQRATLLKSSKHTIFQAMYAFNSSKCHMEVCASRSSNTTFPRELCIREPQMLQGICASKSSRYYIFGGSLCLQALAEPTPLLATLPDHWLHSCQSRLPNFGTPHSQNLAVKECCFAFNGN